jgi:hypothetical protein
MRNIIVFRENIKCIKIDKKENIFWFGCFDEICCEEILIKISDKNTIEKLENGSHLFGSVTEIGYGYEEGFFHEFLENENLINTNPELFI